MRKYIGQINPIARSIKKIVGMFPEDILRFEHRMESKNKKIEGLEEQFSEGFYSSTFPISHRIRMLEGNVKAEIA